MHQSVVKALFIFITALPITSKADSLFVSGNGFNNIQKYDLTNSAFESIYSAQANSIVIKNQSAIFSSSGSASLQILNLQSNIVQSTTLGSGASVLTISGNKLFVADSSINIYNSDNLTLISSINFSGVKSMVAWEDKLIVSSSGASTLLTFDVASGALLNGFGVNGVKAMTLGSNNNLYVSSNAADGIIEYDLTTFQEKSSFGVGSPDALVFGAAGLLYAANDGINIYDTSTKLQVGSIFNSGVKALAYQASAVPENNSLTLLCIGLLAMLRRGKSIKSKCL